MSDTLFDMTPYKSDAAQSYRPDWTDATGPDPSWDVRDRERNIETRTTKKSAQNERDPYTPQPTDNRETNAEEGPARFEQFHCRTDEPDGNALA